MKDGPAFNTFSKNFFYVLVYCSIMITFSSLVFATPPSEIKLEYDQEKKILHMEFKHVSSDPRDHYLRRVFIYKNDVEVVKRQYTKQTNHQKLIDDVPIELRPGDVVRVLAICNEAGRKEETLVIPEKNEESNSP